MNYKNIVIAGGGILGSQIAFQTAYSGFNVTILVREEDSIDEVNSKLDGLKKTYLETIVKMDTPEGKEAGNWARGIASLETFNREECVNKVNQARENIKISTSQQDALADCDLLIESITEIFDVKEAFYKQIAPLLPEKTVVVTNSSTLLPSKLSKFTGRPNKYLAMHFANHIWKNNIAEVMGHDDTEPKYYDEISAFAEAIHMIPLVARNEKSGYLLNSMLVPFLLSAMDLLANGISDPATIDKAWTLGTGAPNGPFQIIDIVGLETARNIVLQYQKVPNLFDPLLRKMMLPYNFDGMLRILDEYINAGKKGQAAGEGFYKYN